MIFLKEVEELKGWPEKVKLMQKNWIGKSFGCEINSQIHNEKSIIVFTTRPDTIYGASFIALSVDHELCKKFQNNKEFETFKRIVTNGATEEALANAEKLGFNTNLFVDHPL